MKRFLILALIASQGFAQTNLDPSSINFSAASGRADFVRFLYFLVNGPSSAYTISGPTNGYTGLINDITGTNALGGGLQTAGYSTCSDIPITGTATVVSGGNTYVMTFSAGNKTIPSHFGSSANQNYDKQIAITRDGVSFMNAQFKCETSSTVTTGYILTTFADEGRSFETFYQTDSSTNAAYLDFFSTFTGTGAEKMLVRFSTTNGNAFNLWVSRGVTNSGGGAIVAVTGNRTLGLAAINMLVETNATTAASNTTAIEGISTGSSGTESTFTDCINLTSNTSVATCTANSVTVSAPGTWDNGSGATAFTLQQAYSLSLSSL